MLEIMTPDTDRPPLLEVRKLKKYFAGRRALFDASAFTVRAVDGVDLEIYRGETLSLVGESGCGKTTLGRMVLRLEVPTEGQVLYDGRDIGSLRGRDLMALRRQVQMIFQDPYSSLNPRKSVARMIGEPLEIHRFGNAAERFSRVLDLMEQVGLTREQMGRYPHEFSGGQRQRIGIARALALQPKLIVADEPVSALDVSVQAQILNLMMDLQRDYDLTYLFISHDLGVVRHVSDRIAVMYLGKIVELASNRDLFEMPRHPYTRALLAAIPSVSRTGRRSGENLSVERGLSSEGNGETVTGCRFYPRCSERMSVCMQETPQLEDCGTNHYVSCFRMHGEG